MSIDKLLRKRQRALADGNQQQLAVICHSIGNWHHENHDYKSAQKFYEEEAEIYAKLSMKMQCARAHRMIGEMCTLLENFTLALEHELIYLKTAKELKDQIEEQRAYATIGRVHLLRAQSNAGEQEVIAKSLRSAEKAFLQSLLICKSLTNLSKAELLDMRARLCLNLGVTYECKGDFDAAIKELEKAMTICRHNDFWDLLQQCYMTTGLLYFNRLNDSTLALRFLNLAINTAERLSDGRTERLCQSLLSMSEVMIKTGDFQGVKQILRRAYKLKSPDESDRTTIEKNLKIVAAICYAEESLSKLETDECYQRKRLYETMGDGACCLRNYASAINYYLKMLEAAEANGEQDKQLVPIYVSLYQTYKDLKDYSKALDFMWKEFELSKDIPSEAYSTLLGIADTFRLAQKDFWETDAIYDRARTEAKKIPSIRKERHILEEQISLREKHEMSTMADALRDELKSLVAKMSTCHDDDESDEEMANSEQEASSEEPNTPNIGDDINLDELTDSENESDEPKNSSTTESNTTASRQLRRRGIVTVKRNEKGETQLHRACIAGNSSLVQRLIDQGHPVNVRDHAGWLPLHEAANHGFKQIVEILLDNGAWINDRGGTNCDGFTPIHDACGNGMLGVVELLLDRGVNVTLRNDLGNTPLQTMELWRKSAKLEQHEQQFYESIHDRLKKQLEKVGISTSPNHSPVKENQRHKSVTPRKRMEIVSETSSDDDGALPDSEPLETVDDIIQEEFPPAEKSTEELLSTPPHRSIIDYTSECDPNYLEVISDLRHGNLQRKNSDDSHFRPVTKVSKRSGMLADDEVTSDDWLIDDVGPSRKKRRYLQERINSNDPSSSSDARHYVPKERRPSSCVDENSVDAFDVLMSANDAPSKRSKRRVSSNSVRSLNSDSRPQSSLLEIGFSRHRLESSDVSSSCIADVTSTVVSPHKIFSPSNVLSTPQALSVKVKVEQNLLNVPVNRNVADDLTIQWLADEASKRYYNLKGNKPVLQITTADGAIFENSDPLTLVFAETNPLSSVVLEWVMPPLSQRYIEACAQMKIDPDHFVQTQLDLVASTQSLTLNDQIVPSKVSRSMFKSLHFQSNLTTLDLSNCFLQDDGTKHLSQALPTLTQLSTLNLTGNLITSIGVKYLNSVFDERSENILAELSSLNLSFNPLSNQSLSPLSKFCFHSKQLKSLNLCSTDFTDFENIDLNFSALHDIDLSHNKLSLRSMAKAIGRLNSCQLTKINLSFCFNSIESRESTDVNSNDFDVVGALAQMLSSGSCTNLVEIHLDGCYLSDTDCWRLIQPLSRAKSLQIVSLRENISLTKVTWKFLLENIHSKYMHVEGCSSLIADLNDADIEQWQIKNHFENIYLTLANDDDAQPQQFELLHRHWTSLNSGDGKIFKMKSRILLTTHPECVSCDTWELIN